MSEGRIFNENDHCTGASDRRPMTFRPLRNDLRLDANESTKRAEARRNDLESIYPRPLANEHRNAERFFSLVSPTPPRISFICSARQSSAPQARRKVNIALESTDRSGWRNAIRDPSVGSESFCASPDDRPSRKGATSALPPFPAVS